MFWIFTFSGIFILYWTDTFNVIYTHCKDGYNNFKLLRIVVSKINKKATIWSSFKIVGKVIYNILTLKFLQHVNKSIQVIDKNNVIVSYVLNNRLYKLAVTPRKGPASVVMITDENDDDVSTDIFPFFGPNRDWHNRPYSPDFWNKKILTFHMASGNILSFENNQTIILN